MFLGLLLDLANVIHTSFKMESQNRTAQWICESLRKTVFRIAIKRYVYM